MTIEQIINWVVIYAMVAAVGAVVSWVVIYTAVKSALYNHANSKEE